MEIIVRLHRFKRDQNKPYAIRFISDPICWTEVPEDLAMLSRQRRRWHLGLIQSIMQNRTMLFNTRYGIIGMLVMPYYVLFEIIGPIIEMTGYVVVLLSALLGLLDLQFLLLFLTLALFYGIFLSMAGIFLEELTYRRYPAWNHLFKLMLSRGPREFRVPPDHFVLEGPGPVPLPYRPHALGAHSIIKDAGRP